MIIPQNQWKTNWCRQNLYFRKHPYVHTTCLLIKKLPLWAAQKWLVHSAYFCDWGIKKDVFCGINSCDVGILWKKCRIYFCDPNGLTKFFQPSLKKKIRYMTFLSGYLLCKNIYTMSSFMWSNELFSILKWWLCLYCIWFYLIF